MRLLSRVPGMALIFTFLIDSAGEIFNVVGVVFFCHTLFAVVGMELFSGRFHHKALYDIAYSPTLKYAAVAGDTGVKLVEMTHFKDLKRESIGLDATDGSIEKIEWSPDGHIRTAATEGGGVHAFLARMPIVHNAHGTTVAYLSSLREITVIAAPRMAPKTTGAERLCTALATLSPLANGSSTPILYLRSGQEQPHVHLPAYVDATNPFAHSGSTALSVTKKSTKSSANVFWFPELYE